jgi:hypothetical protein
MFVTLFGLTSHEGGDAPDASSKRDVVDVKGSRAVAIAGRGESLRGGITPCDQSSRQFNFAGCPLGRVWRSCRVYRENCNDWFRRILLKNSNFCGDHNSEDR